MGSTYRNIIFSTHAEERMQLRNLDAVLIHELWHAPEHIEKLEDGKEKRIATKQDRTVHMIGAFLDDEQKWLLISTWVRGETDPVPWVWQLLVGIVGVLWFGVRMLWHVMRYILQQLKQMLTGR